MAVTGIEPVTLAKLVADPEFTAARVPAGMQVDTTVLTILKNLNQAKFKAYWYKRHEETLDNSIQAQTRKL